MKFYFSTLIIRNLSGIGSKASGPREYLNGNQIKLIFFFKFENKDIDNESLILARYRLNIHSIIDGISLMNDHYDNDDQDEMKKGPVNRAVGIG